MEPMWIGAVIDSGFCVEVEVERCIEALPQEGKPNPLSFMLTKVRPPITM